MEFKIPVNEYIQILRGWVWVDGYGVLKPIIHQVYANTACTLSAAS